MITIYITKPTSKPSVDMRKYLTLNKVPFKVVRLYKATEELRWATYKQMVEGASFTNVSHVTSRNIVVRDTPDHIVEHIDSLSYLDASLYLQENLKILRSCITVDTSRGVTITGFDEDEASVLLKRSTKNRNRKEIMKRAKEVAKHFKEEKENDEEI